jgi:flagellar basal body-associated protein FliL
MLGRGKGGGGRGSKDRMIMIIIIIMNIIVIIIIVVVAVVIVLAHDPTPWMGNDCLEVSITPSPGQVQSTVLVETLLYVTP